MRGLARPVTTLTGVGASDIEVTTEGDSIVIVSLSARLSSFATDERTVRQALEIVRRRIDEVGTREPTIQRQGADRILIQVPGVGQRRRTERLSSAPPRS